MFTKHTASGGGGAKGWLVLALTLLAMLVVILFVLSNRPSAEDAVTEYSGGTSMPTLADRRIVEQQLLDSLS